MSPELSTQQSTSPAKDLVPPSRDRFECVDFDQNLGKLRSDHGAARESKSESEVLEGGKLPAVPLTDEIKAEAFPNFSPLRYSEIDASDLLASRLADKKGANDSKLALKVALRLSKRFLSDLWDVSPSLAVARVASTVLANGTLLFGLYCSGNAVRVLIDRAGSNDMSAELVGWAGATVVMGIASLLSSKWQNYLTTKHNLCINYENFKQISSAIASLPSDIVETKEASSNVTKVRRTEWKINSLCQATFSLVQSSTGTLMAAVALASAPQPMGIMIATGCLVLPGLLSIFSYNRQAERTDQRAVQVTELEKLNNFNRVTLLSPAGIRDLACRLKSGVFIRSLLQNFGVIQKSSEHVAATNTLDQTQADLIGHTATHVGWIAIGMGVVNGVIDMAQFTFLAATLWQARRSLDTLCQDLGRVGENLRFMKPLYDIEDLVKETKETRTPVIFTEAPDIRLSNVKHTYSNSERVALEIDDLYIPQGIRVAIVGENGAGKSTFVKIISGIYVPTTGSVCIGGYDTRESIPFIASIAQDRETFSGETLRSDLSMNLLAKQGIPLSDASRAVLEEIVSEKKLGLDTRKHPTFNDGSGFSIGQSQLLAMVGSFISPARLKIRDEALSALSPPNEVKITQIIEQERGRSTLIDVTHRLAAAATADLILVFEKGKISAQGTHAELINKPGWYQTHFLQQAEAYSSGAQAKESA